MIYLVESRVGPSWDKKCHSKFTTDISFPTGATEWYDSLKHVFQHWQQVETFLVMRGELFLCATCVTGLEVMTQQKGGIWAQKYDRDICFVSIYIDRVDAIFPEYLGMN